MAIGLQDIEQATELGYRGQFAEAIDKLADIVSSCDRATLSGNDLWLEAQSRIIALLGTNGVHRLQLASQQFFGMGKSGERMPATRLQSASTRAVVALRFTSS